MSLIDKSAAEMLRQIAADFAAMNAKYAPIIQQLERNLTATEPQDAIPKTTVRDLKSHGINKVHTDGTWRSDGGNHVTAPNAHESKLVLPPQNAALASILSLQDVDENAPNYSKGLSGRFGYE